MIDERDVQVNITTTGNHEHYRYLHLPTGVAVSDERWAGDGSLLIFREHMFMRLNACVKADRELFA